MKKISDFLGRQVINLAAAKEEGIIINGIMDDKLKKIFYYVLVNEEGFEDEEIYLSLPAVLEGKDILYITGSKQIDQIDQKFIKCPLNARVFNTDGELLGNVKDIEYDERGYTNNIICDNGNILQNDIIIATSTLITVKGNRPIRAQRKKTAPKEVNVEEMMNIPEEVEDLSEITESDSEAFAQAEEKESAEQPPRIISNYNFLLQRKVTKDIYAGSSGIIAEGTIIDDDTVATAQRYGKLVELTIYSK